MSQSRRCQALAALAAVALAILAAACAGVAQNARAAPAADPLGFRFELPAYTVHASEGQLTVTVVRTNILRGAQVRYISSGMGYNPETGRAFDCGGGPCTALDGFDFRTVKGQLNFEPGQASAQFSVPIVALGVQTIPKTFVLSLFGPSTWPGQIGLATPSKAVVTILNDPVVIPRNPRNPLDLPVAPPGGNPLQGARFFVDPQSVAANAAKRNPALRAISTQPGTARFGEFSYGTQWVPNIAVAVGRYLTRAAATAPGTVPLLATYRLVHGHCGRNGSGDTLAEQRSYHDFITGLSQGIGSYRAVLFLEMDALITSPCLNRLGLAARLNELSDAVNILSAANPHLMVYLDAGAADALQVANAASLLKRAGVAKIQGFVLNTTHFDWTKNEITYGNRISKLIGGKHFVVNTGTNGRGPLRPHDIVKNGMEVLCNPKGRGLGPRPTTRTGYASVDMFAWTTNPGESGGQCRDQPDLQMQGAPPTGQYWPAYGLMLVRNADYRVR